ncbi:MAG: FAD-dependent oxidoreductase [Pseudomonadota bacterium]
MTERCEDIVIVGGGIIGLSCAQHLLESGRSPLLIERAQPGQATSFGNAGVISPWSIVPQAMPGLWKKIPHMLLSKMGPAGVSPKHAIAYLPWLWQFLRASNVDRVWDISRAMRELCADSVNGYKSLLSHTGHEKLIRDSYYVHLSRSKQSNALSQLQATLRTTQGGEVDYVEGADLRLLEPAISDQFKSAVVIKGQARTVNPGRLGSVIADKFVSQGGRIKHDTVCDIDASSNGEFVLTTEQGTIKSRRVVLAAGVWSADLLKKFGLKVPLAAERGYHLNFRDTDIQLNNSVMDVENHIVASSMEAGLRLAGMAEFSSADAQPQERFIRRLQRCARAMFPQINLDSADEWMGSRPSFPDSLPVIDQLKSVNGLTLAFGHSHYGLMMAPTTGRIVSSLVNKTPLPISDISPYRLGRF